MHSRKGSGTHRALPLVKMTRTELDALNAATTTVDLDVMAQGEMIRQLLEWRAPSGVISHVIAGRRVHGTMYLNQRHFGTSRDEPKAGFPQGHDPFEGLTETVESRLADTKENRIAA